MNKIKDRLMDNFTISDMDFEDLFEIYGSAGKASNSMSGAKFLRGKTKQDPENKKDVFVKYFSLSKENNGLMYEIFVYKYVHDYSQLNPLIRNYVIDAVDIGFLEKTNTMYVATEFDVGSITLNAAIYDIIKNEDVEYFIKLIFHFMYAVHVLNNEIGVIHEDLHFDNARYTKKQQLYKNKYFIPTKHIDDICVEANIDFVTKIYDFDQSFVYKKSDDGYIKNNPNITEYTCDTYGACNKKSNKDIFAMFTNLYYIERSRINTKVGNMISDVLKIIAPDDNIRNNIIKYLDENDVNPAWNTYCTFENIRGKMKKTNCKTPDYDSLDIKRILYDMYAKYQKIIES